MTDITAGCVVAIATREIGGEKFVARLIGYRINGRAAFEWSNMESEHLGFLRMFLTREVFETKDDALSIYDGDETVSIRTSLVCGG